MNPGSQALVQQRRKLVIDSLHKLFREYWGFDNFDIEAAQQLMNWGQDEYLNITELEIREVFHDLTELHVECNGKWTLTEEDLLELHYPPDGEETSDGEGTSDSEGT